MDEKALTPAVSAAHDKVPVILLDRTVAGYGYTLYIGPDNYFIGRSVGAYVAGLLGSKGGRIVEIQGRAGSPPSMERDAGLRAELVGKPGIAIVDSFGADWLRDRAEDRFADRVASLGRVDIVVAQNDTMAYGAWRAAQAQGLRSIRFIGVDGFGGKDGGLDLVRRGVLAATFVSATGGRAAVEYAMDILDGVKGIPKKIFLSAWKATRTTADDPRLAAPSPASGKRRIVLGYAQTGQESDCARGEYPVDQGFRPSGGHRPALRGLSAQAGKPDRRNQVFHRPEGGCNSLLPPHRGGMGRSARGGEGRRHSGHPVRPDDRHFGRDLVYHLSRSRFRRGRPARGALARRQAGGRRQGGYRRAQGNGRDQAPAIGRKIGFEEIIGATQGYRIVASDNGDFRRSEGLAAMERILDSYHGPIDAVFAHNDDMALGAVQAMEKRELRPGKDIAIVSVDGVRAAFEAMIAGKLSCTVECNPLLGPLLMKAVQDYMNGKALPRQIITSEGIFPAETARKALPNRSY